MKHLQNSSLFLGEADEIDRKKAAGEIENLEKMSRGIQKLC